MSPSPFWAAVHTQPSRDKLAILSLSQRGFETYAPRAVSTRLYRGRPCQTQPRLLFPNYLFVLIVTQWSPINFTPGVRRLVRDGDPR
jgi:hypothetical protein